MAGVGWGPTLRRGWVGVPSRQRYGPFGWFAQLDKWGAWAIDTATAVP